jgi:hypothetical protein
MATLDQWLNFLDPPTTLRFKALRLIGHDFAPPFIKGVGEVRSVDLFTFDFAFSDVFAKPDELIRQIQYHRDNPYDTLGAFRLHGTDVDGLEWALGWADPSVTRGSDGWRVSGALVSGITTCVKGKAYGVSSDRSTEVIFSVPSEHPIAAIFPPAGSLMSGSGVYKKSLKVLDTELNFEYDGTIQALKATIAHTKCFPPPYTENWLGEPFRILFGVLLYPRLVARNLGDENTHVFVRPVHRLRRGNTWGALLDDYMPFCEPDQVWEWYAKLLSLIASAADEKGRPNFEANTITSLYMEIIQSASGTRWVWALTLSSCIECLAKMLKPIGEPDTSLDAAERAAFIKDIEGLNASERLKGLARKALQKPPKTTIGSALRELVKEGVLSETQRASWEAIRHSVMHGNLLPQYSVEAEDQKIAALLEAMRGLTIAVLQK